MLNFNMKKQLTLASIAILLMSSSNLSTLSGIRHFSCIFVLLANAIKIHGNVFHLQCVRNNIFFFPFSFQLNW